jgi:hypothetical protein
VIEKGVPAVKEAENTYTLDQLFASMIKEIKKLSPKEKKEWRDTLTKNLAERITAKRRKS